VVTVHLVDGTFELFRCFHGAPRARGPDGREVGAARGLLATLVALASGASHVAVAFDSVVSPPGAGRSASAEDLIAAQQTLAGEVVRALGMALWPSGRYQADELLSSAAVALADNTEVDQVVICSNDNDFTQCVRGSRVVVLNRITNVVTDESLVRERFGVRPDQIPDLFALVGDRSDGLPGVPGWGWRTAAAALARYGTLDAIPADAAAWDVPMRGRDRLATSLRERWDEVRLCRDLARLRTDVPVPARLDQLEWRGAHRDRIDALVRVLGDDSAVGRIVRWAD